MSYEAGSIANYYLRKAKHDGDEKSMTQMKVIKLVYFAHGFFAGFYENELIENRIEAWKYGPVIPELYSAFSKYGSKPISGLAQEYDRDFKIWNPYDEPEDDAVVDVLDDVWEVYGKLNGIQLSNLSHDPSGPWARVRKEHRRSDNTIPDNLEIPFEYIVDYFGNLAKPVNV